jgi:iron complex outermembrane recepter protein
MTTNGTDTEFFIRGVGPGVGGTGNDPAVALNIDGAYIIRYAASGAFFDLDRVEVLYGPQGTLYGRNSTAGVINVVSKGPADHFEGTVTGEVGDYGLFHGTAAVSIPITDTLRTRFAFDSNHRNGFVSTGKADDTGLDAIDSTAARFTAVWTPGTRLSVRAKVEYWHGGGTGQITVDYPFINPTNPWYTPFSASQWGTYNNSHYYVANAQVDYSLGDHLKLTYIPTYLDSRTDYKTANGGADALSTKVPTTMTRRFILPWNSESNELRLASDHDNYHWLIGLYQYEGDSNADKGLSLSYRAFPGLSTNPLARIQYSGRNNTEEKARAVFSQLGYSLTHTLRLTIGGRYSSDSKDEHTYPGSTTTYGAFTSNGKDQTVVTGSEVIAHVGTKHFDWKAGVEWDAAPRVMFYANAGTGFLDGGVLLQPPPGIPATFKPEYLTQYAVGMKAEFFDRKLRVNTEAYYYDYRGYQLSTSVISPIGGNIVTTTLNADKVRIYGIDGDIEFRPVTHTQFSAKLSYLPTAKIVDFVSVAGNYSAWRRRRLSQARSTPRKASI